MAGPNYMVEVLYGFGDNEKRVVTTSFFNRKRARKMSEDKSKIFNEIASEYQGMEPKDFTKTTKGITFESNLGTIYKLMKQYPMDVFKIIGKAIVNEVRPKVPKASAPHSFAEGAPELKPGRLRKSLGYWVKKKGRAELQIGYKAFYAPFVLGTENEPIKAAVIRHKDEIVELLAEAYNDIKKRWD